MRKKIVVMVIVMIICSVVPINGTSGRLKKHQLLIVMD